MPTSASPVVVRPMVPRCCTARRRSSTFCSVLATSIKWVGVAADEERLQDLALHFAASLPSDTSATALHARPSRPAGGRLPAAAPAPSRCWRAASMRALSPETMNERRIWRLMSTSLELGVDLGEDGAVLGRAVDAEVLNRAALHVGIRSALGDRRSAPGGRAASCSAPARTARAPSAAATRCPAGSSRASARPVRDPSAAGPGWRAASAPHPIRLRGAAPGRRSGAPAARAPWRRLIQRLCG